MTQRLLPDLQKKYKHFNQLKYPSKVTNKTETKFNAFSCIRNVRSNIMPFIGDRSKSKSRESVPTNDRNRYFSYHKIIKDYFSNLVCSEKAVTFKEDIENLVEVVIEETDMNVIRESMSQFKKKSKYFKFKLIESRILFYIILAELEIYNKNHKKAMEEFEFCEYHARK